MSAPFKLGFWIEVRHITAEYMYGLGWVVTPGTVPCAFENVRLLATCRFKKEMKGYVG